MNAGDRVHIENDGDYAVWLAQGVLAYVSGDEGRWRDFLQWVVAQQADYLDQQDREKIVHLTQGNGASLMSLANMVLEHGQTSIYALRAFRQGLDTTAQDG